MPFYISQIDGAQIPYEPLAAAELRELGKPEYLREIEEISHEEVSPAAYNEIAQFAPQATTHETYSSTATSLAASTVINSKSYAARTERLSSNHLPSRDKPIAPVQKSSREASDLPSEDVVQKEVINAYVQGERENNAAPRLVVEIGEIMTSPVLTLPENSSIDDVWNFIQEKRFRHVPIVSQENKLIGIVSDRDFIKIKQFDGLDSIRKIITSNIITARPETDIRSAAKLMFDERIGALPIVDSNESLVGMLTRTDILRVLYKRAPLELWS